MTTIANEQTPTSQANPYLIQVSALKPFEERYAALEKQPGPHGVELLRITAVLRENSPVASYDPVHLDNLIARGVVDLATEGRGLHDASKPYALPIPLLCLWRDPWGLPLWASTCFVPNQAHLPDTVYSHKRAQSGNFTATKSGKFSVVVKSGRYMERRIPTPVTISPSWSAFCVGNIAEIVRLLEGLAFFGKKRSIGFGEIETWEIEPFPLKDFHPTDLLVHNNRLTRPLPMAARHLLGERIPEGAVTLLGWTPPQWNPKAFQAGWRVGTPVGSVVEKGAKP